MGSLGVLGACAALSACAAPNNTSWWDDLGSVASSHASNRFNFDWHLVGDQYIAPLHIFSSEKQVWLQYAAAQVPPVITELALNNRSPFSPRQHGGYWVIDTDAKALQFQSGEYQAWAYLEDARHLAESQIRSAATQKEEALSLAKVSVLPVTIPVLNDHSPIVAPTESSALPLISQVSTSHAPAETHIEPNAARPDKNIPEAVIAETYYQASPDDQNLRRVLHRWANENNWTFDTEHWAVDVDLPITASFSISSSFTEAVQALVASTQLGSHPLKPCFYSNQVLRIIRIAQSCAPASFPAEGDA